MRFLKYKKYASLFLASSVTLVILSTLGQFADFGNNNHDDIPSENIENAKNSSYINSTTDNTEHESQKPILLVHDVSPPYFDELKEIVEIIDKHNYSRNTVLFVIPDFENMTNNGKWDLRKNKEFVDYLHELKERGYRIELHGYKHTYHEFKYPKNIASDKLQKATVIMRDCGFNNTTLFLPPAWALSNESIEILTENNHTIILTDKIILPNGTTKKISNHEYTWYLKNHSVELYLKKAKLDYYIASKNKIPYYISMHPGVVNYGGGLIFLDKFLNETGKM